MSAILKHALKLPRAGKPVFPCRQDNKRPLIEGGFKAATTDAEQIRAWWEKWPAAMIGMPTGPASGVWVLDVDAAKDGEAGDGHASLAELTGRHGQIPPTRTHTTPSGGVHMLFKYPAGREVRNSASKIGPLLDVRGEGGYIIMPPSVNAEGKAYRVTAVGKAADAPDWLLDLVAPPPKAEHDRPAPQAYRYHGGPIHSYVAKAVENEIAAVSTAPSGGRNHTLNTAAYALGRWVAGGELSESEALDRLLQAALVCGLPESEARKTLESGLSAGMREPRQAPVSSGDRAEPPKEEVTTADQQPEHSASHLRCVNAYDFLSMSFPAREMLLSPIIPRQGLCMLHAMRGIGKTFISLSVAYAVASGGKVFGRWGAPHPARVLFLDGEMPARTLQERLASLVAGSATEPPNNEYLRILTPDMQPCPMPNLATREGQEAVEPLLEGVDLIVMDNLSTLARNGRSNDEESWLPVQGWLLGLRRRGISVLMIHHQGKGGDQRGTSAKEDILDTVIRLDRPKDYRSEQGARFEVHLTKARGICGDDVKPFEAQLFTEGLALTWTTRTIEDAELEQLRQLLDEGFTIRDAAAEMGLSKSAVGRLKKRLDAVQTDSRISQGTDFYSLEASHEQ